MVSNNQEYFDTDTLHGNLTTSRNALCLNTLFQCASQKDISMRICLENTNNFSNQSGFELWCVQPSYEKISPTEKTTQDCTLSDIFPELNKMDSENSCIVKNDKTCSKLNAEECAFETVLTYSLNLDSHKCTFKTETEGSCVTAKSKKTPVLSTTQTCTHSRTLPFTTLQNSEYFKKETQIDLFSCDNHCNDASSHKLTYTMSSDKRRSSNICDIDAAKKRRETVDETFVPPFLFSTRSKLVDHLEPRNSSSLLKTSKKSTTGFIRENLPQVSSQHVHTKKFTKNKSTAQYFFIDIQFAKETLTDSSSSSSSSSSSTLCPFTDSTTNGPSWAYFLSNVNVNVGLSITLQNSDRFKHNTSYLPEPYNENLFTIVNPELAQQETRKTVALNTTDTVHPNTLPCFAPFTSLDSNVASPEANTVTISKDLVERIDHSTKYYDDVFEYRYVVLPLSHPFVSNDASFWSTKDKILSEKEWRLLGIRQTKGWEHVGYSNFEKNILLFRRPIGTDPKTGILAAEKQEELDKRRNALQNMDICADYLESTRLAKNMSSFISEQDFSIPEPYNSLTPLVCHTKIYDYTEAKNSSIFFNLSTVQRNRKKSVTSELSSLAAQRAQFIENVDSLNRSLYSPSFLFQ